MVLFLVLRLVQLCQGLETGLMVRIAGILFLLRVGQVLNELQLLIFTVPFVTGIDIHMGARRHVGTMGFRRVVKVILLGLQIFEEI